MLREKVKNLFDGAKEIGNVQIMSVEIAQNVLDVPNVATFCDTVITDEKVLLIEDDDNIEAEVLGEKESATDNNIILNGNGVLGKEKTRITTNVKFSQMLLNDTDNIKDFYEILNKRIARKLAKVIVNGDEKFKGKSLCNVDKTIDGDCTIDNLRALMLEMKEEYLSEACFIVSEDNFKILSKKKKSNEEYYITFCKETGLYEIFGVPMMVMDTLNCNGLLVNIKSAYKLIISPTIDLRDFSKDKMLNLQGVDGISLSIYVDGGLKNTNAIKKLA